MNLRIEVPKQRKSAYKVNAISGEQRSKQRKTFEARWIIVRAVPEIYKAIDGVHQIKSKEKIVPRREAAHRWAEMRHKLSLLD